mmetsp:Transcript_33538/g.53783  ORF Transcript_33538/g.53783 Transcript_33538/m.53783 type:complete len:262 (-) Transcript_33538:371-1156(-)
MPLKEGFEAVPGLLNEIELSAWKRRREAPLIHVLGSPSDNTDGSELLVRLMPRSYWDLDPDSTSNSMFTDDHREYLRQLFDEDSFDLDEHYLSVFTIATPGQKSDTIVCNNTYSVRVICRGPEIAKALTASTRAHDLADAIDWYGQWPRSEGKQKRPQEIRNRSRNAHGDQMPQGSAPVPSRALNNEVACIIMHDLDLQCAVRLTGLRGAAHLNGREGVICGADLADNERWRARPDDGKLINVRAVNFVHIRQGEYKCRSP